MGFRSLHLLCCTNIGLLLELDALSAFDEDEEAAYLDAVTTPVEIDSRLLEEHGIVCTSLTYLVKSLYSPSSSRFIL